MSDSTAVFGKADRTAVAIEAVEALQAAGFARSEISASFPELAASNDVCIQQYTKAPEGAVAGIGVGSALGLGVGCLATIGVLAIPGFGPFIAVGPIMTALSAAATGALVGGLTGTVIGMGIPAEEISRYQTAIARGAILLSVHAESRREIQRAKDILQRVGVVDVCYTEEVTIRQRTRVG